MVKKKISVLHLVVIVAREYTSEADGGRGELEGGKVHISVCELKCVEIRMYVDSSLYLQ